MATRNRTLHFAVTGALLALAPVGTCELLELAPDTQRSDPGDGHDPQDTIRVRDGGPIVNPGPIDDGAD
jgi:hypothetical protein